MACNAASNYRINGGFCTLITVLMRHRIPAGARAK